MKQNTHFVVQQQDFELLQGQEHLTLYQVLSLSFDIEPNLKHCFCACGKISRQSRSKLSPFLWLQFNTKTAKHYFCKTCGVQSYYVPRSNPDGYAVTVACVDPGTLAKVVIQDVDGSNWEKVYQEKGFAAMS